ncbi:phage tail tube protein [Endozoicomonas sp. GU-1]|uniref:phage tail tube protein n=1 Tax=Endozoicomonas sp. GU-1 TaxID=3009078 RepID=UPI0022B2FC3D|nr:phage tail tube protein [Endozoicomonas sp. GU-1]WBA79553.1 phage tail tube protein [Endozoicomonas sp. GU-1]
MPIATGARHSMAYVAESAYGQTPATPAFNPIRHTSTSLALTKETIQSEELRDDRQLAAFKHGNKQVGGDISFEFSHDSFDDFLEAALCGTWASDELKTGVTRRSFTVERHFSDIGQYHRFSGVELNGFTLSVAPNAMVTGTFTTVGKGLATATTPITGATYADASTTAPFDSFSGALTVNGAASAVVTSVELTLENGLEVLFVIGSDETLQPSIGRSNLTGSMSVYLEDGSMIDRFINETETELAFTLAGDGGSYTFTLPRIKFGSGAPEVSGTGPVVLNMDFQALFDATEQTNLKIERAVAV